MGSEQITRDKDPRGWGLGALPELGLDGPGVPSGTAPLAQGRGSLPGVGGLLPGLRSPGPFYPTAGLTPRPTGLLGIGQMSLRFCCGFKPLQTRKMFPLHSERERVAATAAPSTYRRGGDGAHRQAGSLAEGRAKPSRGARERGTAALQPDP